MEESSMEKSNFSINVKFLRESKKMTQQELANRLNYSRDGIAKWEKQGRRPDYETLLELASLFNIHIEEILNINLPETISNISSCILSNYDLGYDEPVAECDYLKQHYIREYEKICETAVKDNDKHLSKYCVNGYIKNGGKNLEYIKDVYYKICSLEENEDDKIDIYVKIHAIENHIEDPWFYTWEDILDSLI
ncbi:MAG: helix-turn-helix transcriptional regulator [Lachnospiraceae bacterium]|nr:helix-turn-helix transcriptional regulator [Lachnospiraceae bacterium]